MAYHVGVASLNLLGSLIDILLESIIHEASTYKNDNEIETNDGESFEKE